MKIATLGPVIGTMTQDRATAIGGTLGAGPRELAVHLTLDVGRGRRRAASRSTSLRDQTLTPLFTYVAVLNALTSYERQAGVLSIAANGTLSFGCDGSVAIDDSSPATRPCNAAAAAVAAPIGLAATNEFRTVMPRSTRRSILRDLGKQESTTIERVVARHDAAAVRRGSTRCRSSCRTTAAPRRPSRCR